MLQHVGPVYLVLAVRDREAEFVQDGLDYFSNVHHTNLDTLDHASAEDLKQAAAIVASMAYDAAMQPQRFPRKPLAKD